MVWALGSPGKLCTFICQKTLLDVGTSFGQLRIFLHNILPTSTPHANCGEIWLGRERSGGEARGGGQGRVYSLRLSQLQYLHVNYCNSTGLSESLVAGCCV